MLGPPGAGKGTQAKRLAADLRIPAISTGDIFRANISDGTELGVRVQAILRDGGLVPDEVTNDMVRDRIGQADCGDGGHRVLTARIKAKLTVGIACARGCPQAEARSQAQGCLYQSRVADRDRVATDSHKGSRYVTRKCRAPSHCDNNHIIHNHHHGKSSRRGQEAHQSRSRRIESSRRRGLTTAQSRTDKTCEAGSRYSPAEGHQSEAKSSCCQAGGYDC